MRFAGAAMHLALTAQTVMASEALRLGLVSQVVEGSGQEAARIAGLALAVKIAAKPSLAVMGTKRVLLHARYAWIHIHKCKIVHVLQSLIKMTIAFYHHRIACNIERLA